MDIENLSTLKIHTLTQEQYDREFAAGNIDTKAMYLTPDEDIEVPTKVSELENDAGYITADEMPEIDIDEVIERTADTENNYAPEYAPEDDAIYWKDNTTIDLVYGTFKASVYPCCVTPEIDVLSGEYCKVEGDCYETNAYQYGFDGGLVEVTSLVNDGVFKVCDNTATIRLIVPKFNDTGEEIDLNGTIEHFNNKFKLYYCDRYKLKENVLLPDNVIIPNAPTKVSQLENDNGYITADVIGDLSLLETVNKGSLIDAINEINAKNLVTVSMENASIETDKDGNNVIVAGGVTI